MSILHAFLIAVLTTMPSAPASQPSADSDLRRIIHGLQEQIVALKAENAELSAKLSNVANQKPEIVKPANTFTFRARKITHATALAGNGSSEYTSKEKADFVLAARKKDAEIETFLKQNDCSVEISNAMYAGSYAIGMTEAAVKIISEECTEDTVTIDSKVLKVYPWQPDPVGIVPIQFVFLRNGRIYRIDKNVGETEFAH